MEQINYYKDIILALKAERIDFIICGGVALVLHGIERLTLDIDLSLDLKRDNIGRFLKVMKEQHMTPRVPVPAETLLDPELRREMIEKKNALVFTFIDPANPYRQIDVFIADSLSYDSLKNDVEYVLIGSMRIPVASKRMLLTMKKSIHPPRDKDEYDIRMLEKLIGKE